MLPTSRRGFLGRLLAIGAGTAVVVAAPSTSTPATPDELYKAYLKSVVRTHIPGPPRDLGGQYVSRPLHGGTYARGETFTISRSRTTVRVEE